MANTTLSPYMSLPVPTVSQDPGPDWATNYDACLSILDAHSHVPGSGVQITPAGLDINIDLSFGGNNATLLRTARFSSQSAALSAAADVGCLYEVLNDLYFNDGVGNQIRITQSGSVTGATGTITGLPSGTASAAYAAGTFTFQSATSTPATMAVGPLVVGNAVANSKTVTIAPNASIAANYNFTLPAALPGSTNYTTLDSSGNVSYNSSGSSGSGAVVLATSPTIATATITSPSISSPSISTATFTGLTTVSASGIAFASGTMVDYKEGTWSPTLTNVSNTSALSTLGTARYQRIGNFVYCTIYNQFNWSSAGLTSFSWTTTLPVLPNNNFSQGDATGTCSNIFGSSSQFFSITNTSSAKTITTLVTFSSATPGSGNTQIASTFRYFVDN